MRKVVKIVLVAAILSGSFMGFANKSNTDYVFDGHGVVKNLISVDLDPTFKRKGNRVMMNLLNLSKGKVILKVLDAEGKELFNEVLDDKLIVEKSFNFVDAYTGEYTIVVVDYNGTYKTTFNKK
jgi:hypothetical protein